MARAAVKAKQQAKASAQPAKRRVRGRHHSSGGNPNQQLFFSRMRRKAKFAYFFLAILFAVTFAFLGVGSGSNGLSDLFTNLNIFHHSGTSVSSAQKEIADHPNAPGGYRKLATAYEGKGQTASAITALQQYVALNKKDGKALSELAGLQLSQAGDYQNQYGAAYTRAQLAAASAPFIPAGKLGKALGTNPIEQSQSTLAGTAAQNIGQRMSLAYAGAVSTYQQLAKLQPGNANAQFQLGNTAQTAAQITGSTSFNTTAVAAYKAFLKLSPDASTAAQVRQLIKSLEPAKH
jgi:tetratricopeptide (TPR) repeat protein